MLNGQFSNGYTEKLVSLCDITEIVFEQSHLWKLIGIYM